ncbi:hypothetical protein [Candidatus Entotheonella palauensis]|uniref:hypothetical protein n=1 Tax=Candidatus Entotheonella palauensis TaxID=93172 RepID=UPI000B7E0DE6|nr:hypothetical protein [Candidatus Entotheonella palauensis]
MQEKVVKVEAQANSTTGGHLLDTGMEVKTGQTLRVRALFNDTWSADSGGRISNANGLGNPKGETFGLYTANGFSFLYGCLVGSLDGGKTMFPVGTEMIMQNLGATGTLSLGYWDSDHSNNSGSVSAEVTVSGEPASL